MGRTPKRRAEIICRCNNISRQTIEQAIADGCHTLNEIFDATTAGVGPCGGSCRRKLGPLLQHYLDHGAFPEKIIEDLTGKACAPSTPASEKPASPQLSTTSESSKNSENPKIADDPADDSN